MSYRAPTLNRTAGVAGAGRTGSETILDGWRAPGFRPVHRAAPPGSGGVRPPASLKQRARGPPPRPSTLAAAPGPVAVSGL